MRAKFGLVPTAVSKILSFKFISRYCKSFPNLISIIKYVISDCNEAEVKMASM